MKNKEDMILGRALIMTLINFMSIWCAVILCGYNVIEHRNLSGVVEVVLTFIVAFGVGFLQGIGMTVIEDHIDHKDDEAE